MVVDSKVRGGPEPGGTIMVGETQGVFLSITDTSCNLKVMFWFLFLDTGPSSVRDVSSSF